MTHELIDDTNNGVAALIVRKNLIARLDLLASKKTNYLGYFHCLMTNLCKYAGRKFV